MTLNADLTLAQLPSDAVEGLRQPRVVTLQAGQILFRFASSDRPKETWAARPWWMYEHDYRKIIQTNDESDLSLGLLGRWAMAVPQSVSKMDVVIKAVVLQDVNAFCGLGRTQYRDLLPNGMWLTLRGWPHVNQLYIPNVGDAHGRTLLGYQALTVLRQKLVSSHQLA